MLKSLLFGLTLLAGLVTARPATAGDLDKFLPSNSEFYVHISVPKLFGSELVRKAVPMAFDKYSDMIAKNVGMMKGIPNFPPIEEEQVKEGLKQLADPDAIAMMFDMAKGVITDIVIAGSQNGGDPDIVILLKSKQIKAEILESVASGLAAFPGAADQITVETTNHDAGTIYTFIPAQAKEAKFLVTVPEEGILCVSRNKATAQATLEAKSKPSDKLAELKKARKETDFVFMTGVGDEKVPFTTMTLNVVLDKDLAGKVTVNYKDEAKAKEQVNEVNEQVSKMLEQLKEMLGDKSEILKPHIEKSKAVVDGKTVTGTISIPGKVFESMLKKENEKDK